MFYKGILKSYDVNEQTGLIHIADKDIDLHFSIQDFPNSALEPQVGERVKCLMEDRDNKQVAKFIVRLDHKNARTEKPRNNIFYSEDEDIVAVKNSDEGKAEVTETDKEDKTKLTSTSIKNTAENPKLPNTSVKSSSIHSDLTKTIAQPEAISLTSLVTDETENPSDEMQELKSSNNIVENEEPKEELPELKLGTEDGHGQVESEVTEKNQVNESSAIVLLKPEDEIKIPQSLPLSALAQPVDVDIAGTLDLSNPKDIKPIPNINQQLDHSGNTKTSMHLGEPTHRIQNQFDPFEQLQRDMGVESNRASATQNQAVIPSLPATNQDTRSQLSSSNASAADEPIQLTNGEHSIQKAKTHFAYKTQKVKSHHQAQLSINPWVLMGLITLCLLAAFGYFGFKKYQSHKEEQEAKARYYLLEQQKAIEDQRKKMAHLSNKPIIPAERRKELLGENAK